MKILVDTNVLFSALLFPNGVCSKALAFGMLRGDQFIIPDYVKGELVKTVGRIFPDRVNDVSSFLEAMPHSGVVSAVYEGTAPALRDEKDMSVLLDAIIADCDLILTGDNDFLESGIEKPKPIHPISYLNLP